MWLSYGVDLQKALLSKSQGFPQLDGDHRVPDLRLTVFAAEKQL